MGTAQAGSIESFCSEVTKSRPEKSSPKGVGKFLLKFIFSPESLVEVQTVSSLLPQKTQPNRVKLAFLSLPKVELSRKEKEELKTLKNKRKLSLKDLKKRSFYKSLAKTSNQEECLSFLKDNNFTTTLKELDKIAPRYLELKQIEADDYAFKTQSKKRSFLRKDGWKIFENKNLNEIFSIVQELKPNDLLLIGHASNDGKTYDAFKNAFPKNYFENLGIDNLILYSCYSEESVDYYSFGKYNIFTTSPTSFAEQFLDDSIPLNSLKVIKSIELKSLMRPRTEICSFELPVKETSTLLSINLNKSFIGAVAKKVNFPCSLLKETNSVEIFSTLNERHFGSIEINTLYFNNNAIHLNEFITTKNNRHIVSRGTF